MATPLNITKTTVADFNAGTLSNVAAFAVGDGELQLAHFLDDGFESGNFSNWNAAFNASIVTSPVNSGTRAAQLGSSSAAGSITKSGLGSVDIVYVRLYFRASSSGHEYQCCNIEDSGGNILDLVVFGTNQHFEYYDNPSGTYGTFLFANDTTWAANVWYKIEVVINQNTQTFRAWVNGSELTNGWTSIKTPSGGSFSGISALHISSSINPSDAAGFVDDVLIRTVTSGTYTSEVLDLSSIGGTVASGIASFTETVPSGASVTVETNLSLNGGSTWAGWASASNGGAISGAAGSDLSNARLQVRATLSATSKDTPAFDSITLQFGVQPTAVSTDTTDAIYLVPIVNADAITTVYNSPTVNADVVADAYIATVTPVLADTDSLTYFPVTTVVADTKAWIRYILPRTRRQRTRALIGGSWVDLSDRVSDGKVVKDVDNAASTGSVVFFNAPTDGDNLWHRYGGILAPGITIQIEGAFRTDGQQPLDSDLYPVFYGELGPSNKSSTIAGKRSLSVEAVDLASRRISRKQLGESTGLSPGNAKDVIQDICNLAAPGMFTVYSTETITATVTQKGLDDTCQNVNAWQAIQSIALQSGLDCRWTFVPSLGEWRIVLQTPNRDVSTYDRSLGPDVRFDDEIEETDDYTRNRVKIGYKDATTGSRMEVVWENTDPADPYSIPNYGEAEVSITEADNSIIDNAIEAQAEANIIGQDLGGIYERFNINDMAFDPTIELFERAFVPDEGVIHAINHVEHSFSSEDFVTSVQTSGRQVLRVQYWLARHNGEGAKRQLVSGDYKTQSVQSYHLEGKLTGNGKILIDGNLLKSLDALSALRVAIGDISGLTWGGGSVPSGTFGLWGTKAGIWLNGYPKIVAAGSDLFQLVNSTVAAGASGTLINYTDTDFLTSGNSKFIPDYHVYPGRKLVCMGFFPTINLPSGLVVESSIVQWRATERSLNAFQYNVMLATGADGNDYGDFELWLEVGVRNVTSGSIQTSPTATNVPYFWMILDVDD